MFKFSRLLVIYVIAAPLALLLGFLVSAPGRFSISVIGMVLFFLTLPLFLKWHHVWLILFWNSVFNFAFLPGSPDLWLLLAVLSFGISFLNYVITQKHFLRAPELTRPVLLLAVVVLVTAECRGGIGIRALGGSTYGGRYYLFILGAIAGYFAFSSERVPIGKARKMGELFFLSGTTFALSNIIYVFGPIFYPLYFIVPSGSAMGQAANDLGMTDIDRLSGVGPASIAALCFLLAHYGIRGLFDFNRPWRFMLLCLTVAAGCFAGFRSIIVMLSLVFAFQFYFEGLLRTHYFPIVLGLAVAGLLPILFFAKAMPHSVQRAISFLPVNVDSEILADAKGSSEWRFEMWSTVSKEIPKYFFLGKGYVINPDDLFATVEAARLGIQTSAYEGSMVAGDYHSGPLSVIIPFGIFGVISFGWVLIGGYRVLYWNYRFGDARLRRVNTTLLAFYVSQCIAFVFIFGALNTELSAFLGICGMSVCLNGGVKRRAAPRRQVVSVPHGALAMEPG